MKLALLVYLASIVDNISNIFGLVGFLGFLVYFGILAIIHFSGYGIKEYSFESDDQISKQNKVKEVYTKYWKLSAVLFPFIMVISALLPSEKTIYIMAGAYATEQIATNDRVQKIGSEVLEVIEGKLQKMKEDN